MKQMIDKTDGMNSRKKIMIISKEGPTIEWNACKLGQRYNPVWKALFSKVGLYEASG